MTSSIPENLRKVRLRISQFEHKYERVINSVKLLAVSKTHGPDSIRSACLSDQSDFGENYLQEALDKQLALADLAINWHFIGPIQSNKTRLIAEHFHWVHSVDRLKIAQRLQDQRPPNLPPLQVLLQVNISQEDSKSGVLTSELDALAAAISKMPRLVLSGLMTIPAPSQDVEQQRRNFRQLREARDTLLNAGYQQCQHLSMGMSNDFEAAIAEGATMVRIGTDVFGPRGV